MPVTINNIIESLLNPAGRFNSLEDIRPELDERGDPVFSYNGKTADFNVLWQGQHYMLKTRACPSSGNRTEWSAPTLKSLLEDHSDKYLVDYHFQPDEMLVFDDAGNGHFVDIVLMRHPGGITLDKFLVNVCDEEDFRQLRKLKYELCHRGAWLLRNRMVHRRIRAANIVVSPEGIPVLINYESMIPLTPGVNSESSTADNIALASIVLVLTVLRHNPKLYRQLYQGSMFRLPFLRDGLLTLVEDAAVRSGNPELAEIARLLSGHETSLTSPEALAVVLDELAEEDKPLEIDPLRLAELSRFVGEPVREVEISESRRKTRKLNLSAYDFIGLYCEELICVSKNDLWGYIDKEDKPVIPLR